MTTSIFSWHLLIICSITFLSFQLCSGQCLSDQRALLLLLNNSLEFDIAVSDSNSLQWNLSTDCCTWEGVCCQDGHVTGLQLSNKSIIGGLLMDNSSLFHFQYLKSLDLSFNNLDTPIPSRLGNLTSLTHLNLSYSGFFGNIPTEILRLTNLVTLDLSTWFFRQNPLKVDHSNWSMLFQNLTKLQQLYLDDVDMSATGKEWSRVFSSSLPNLQVLSLPGCSLSGPIDQSLLKLQSLSVICLDDNSLSSPVPRFIANFSMLTSLHLRSCGLHGTFPKDIFQVSILDTIDISYNLRLQGSLPEFSPNNSLQNLMLSGTSFSGRLPTSVGNLTKLSTLDLSLCLFNGTLPNFMLPELVYLDLSNNKFDGPIPSFRFAKNLATIRLSHNGLSGAIPSAHWEGLPKILIVELGNNFFNGTLPTSLFSVPSLVHVDLSYNHFNGHLPELPTSSMLQVLDLSRNNLEGPVPMAMFQLKYLEFLSLAFNKLNDTIKLDAVTGLVKLIYLDLSYSNLSVTVNANENENANATAWSSFPKGLMRLNLASCKLKSFPNLQNQSILAELDLSNNQIHGVIPNWIWDLGSGFTGLTHLNLSRNCLVGFQEPYSLPSFLFTLDLHFNQIRGKFPTTLPQSIEYIDFSSNNFYSSIPADIGKKCSSFFLLSLSYNNLSGVIPESICNMSSLQLLDLSRNNLSGRLPGCMISKLSRSLVVLNLRRNSLTGAIPASLPVSCSLVTLDLNGNLIQGKIPKSLVSCSDLEVLDLGSNSLIDEFPCFLKNISALRVLVLRSNKFHGSIGCSNANETWEKLQIIDLAHNCFNGELPGHKFTNWKSMVSGEDDALHKLNHLQIEVRKDSQWYYEDSTTLTIKGQDMNLVKILTIDICIDFSSNNFSGQIPKELGSLELLYALNLSNNAFSGPIPWSLGNLYSLESLDLSRNKLNGTIPTSLANLNFLSHLDLSFNNLVGMIPSGRQFQTFSASSFLGNQGLCGFPLIINCTKTEEGTQDHSTTAEDNHSDSDSSETKIDWNIISVEIGFIVGFASIVAPLVFCKRLRELYFETMEDVAYRILPLSVTRKWLSWTTAR